MKAAKIMALLSILAAIPAATIWLHMDKLSGKQNQNPKMANNHESASLIRMTSR